MNYWSTLISPRVFIGVSLADIFASQESRRSGAGTWLGKTRPASWPAINTLMIEHIRKYGNEHCHFNGGRKSPDHTLLTETAAQTGNFFLFIYWGLWRWGRVADKLDNSGPRCNALLWWQLCLGSSLALLSSCTAERVSPREENWIYTERGD